MKEDYIYECRVSFLTNEEKKGKSQDEIHIRAVMQEPGRREIIYNHSPSPLERIIQSYDRPVSQMYNPKGSDIAGLNDHVYELLLEMNEKNITYQEALVNLFHPFRVPGEYFCMTWDVSIVHRINIRQLSDLLLAFSKCKTEFEMVNCHPLAMDFCLDIYEKYYILEHKLWLITGTQKFLKRKKITTIRTEGVTIYMSANGDIKRCILNFKSDDRSN